MRSFLVALGTGVVIVAQAIAAPTFSFRTRTERPPEMDAITIAEIEFDGERFSLVLPRNWRLDSDLADRSLRFHSELNRAAVVVQFAPEIPEGVLKSTDALR